MADIKTSDGTTFVVDDEDYPVLKRFSWRLVRDVPATTINGVSVLVTRFLMPPQQFKEVAHKSSDKLDNRKSNLKYSLRSYTTQKGERKPGTSKYRGVHYSNEKNKWVSKISQGGKDYFLGNFEDEVIAARAYDIKALELFGDEALVNFPLQNYTD